MGISVLGVGHRLADDTAAPAPPQAGWRLRSVSVRNYGDPIAADPPGGWGGWGLGKPDRTVWPTARLSVAGTPVPTYYDGFPRPHPPRPPSPWCSRSDLGLEWQGSRVRPEAIACPQLPTTRWLEVGRDRRYSTRVLRCTTPRPERRVEGGRDGRAFGNPSSYGVTGVPLTDIQADG